MGNPGRNSIELKFSHAIRNKASPIRKAVETVCLQIPHRKGSIPGPKVYKVVSACACGIHRL